MLLSSSLPLELSVGLTSDHSTKDSHDRRALEHSGRPSDTRQYVLEHGSQCGRVSSQLSLQFGFCLTKNESMIAVAL